MSTTIENLKKASKLRSKNRDTIIRSVDNITRTALAAQEAAKKKESGKA